MAERQKLVHLHTSENRAPSASVLNYGEIAVQHNEQEPALYIKTGENTVEKFISKTGVEKLISASTEEFVALKSEVIGVGGYVSAIQESYVTDVVVNGVSGTTTDNVASVTIDADDIAVGGDITYSGKTLVNSTTTTKSALQTLATKIEGIDGIISESNHSHDNKTVLDGISTEDVEAWDNAVENAHAHENKDELDLIKSGDVQAWNEGLETIDAIVSGYALSAVVETEISAITATIEENERIIATSLNDINSRLNAVSAVGQTNVLEGVQVNGSDLTIGASKKVNVTITGGSSNGTIAVNGTDVTVTGLGSAAFENTTAFDETGAAAAASAAAYTSAVTALVGDMTGATKTLGGLEDRIDSLESDAAITMTAYTGSDTGLTEGYLKTYEFFQGSSSIGKVDIPRDLVVTSGVITADSQDRQVLRLTIANQAEPVDILVSDLVDVYTAGNGIEISSGNEISAKVVAGNGLSLDSNGIAMAAASSAGAGAMSAADFDKLASVAASAQVNTVEGVQVNGADLTPDANKKVNVTITSGSTNGTIAVNGTDVEVKGLGSAAFEDTTAFDEAGAAAAASAAAVTSANSYTDAKVASYVSAATGDALVSASVANNTVTVAATQDLQNAVAAANSSVQGIETGKESGAQLNANRELDFSEFGIDCGTY